MASRTSLTFFSLLFCAGCFPPGEGVSPPTERIYFPVGVALNADQSRLFVASSDFDLQYTAGVVQAFDLERVRELVPIPCRTDADCIAQQGVSGRMDWVASRSDCDETAHDGHVPSYLCVTTGTGNSGTDAPPTERWEGAPCGPLGELSLAQRFNVPMRCGHVDLVKPQDNGAPILVEAVQVGAFASDLIYRARPSGGDGELHPQGRLFLPVRGDATLHFIDVADPRTGFELSCGQGTSGGRCSGAFRVGDDPEAENTRDLRLPPEPFGLDASEDGRTIVVSHQTQGAASLFVHDWEAAPRLEYVASGLPSRVVGVAALPVPAVVSWRAGQLPLNTQAGAYAAAALYQPGFLLTFSNGDHIQLMRYIADTGPGQETDPARPYLQGAGLTVVAQNSVGSDSRGVAVDGSDRRACEAKCETPPAEYEACLASCAKIPLDVYVANRTPNSLLVGRTQPHDDRTPIDDVPYLYDSISLPIGASRVVVGNVLDVDGALKRRVFIISFEERKLTIYNPESRMIEKLVTTGRGPHAFAVDADPNRPGPKALGYLAHFTDSWVGVIDLDRSHTQTYGTIVLGVGEPREPRGTK